MSRQTDLKEVREETELNNSVFFTPNLLISQVTFASVSIVHFTFSSFGKRSKSSLLTMKIYSGANKVNLF